MPKLLGMLAVLSVTLIAHGGAAYGAAASKAPGDPATGSPAGAVYELPLERGRAEAAPKGSGGTVAPDGEGGGAGESGQGGEAAVGGEAESGGGSGDAAASESGDEEGSLYRSENNFGSSSQVPGAPDGAGGAGSEGAADLARGREAAQASDSGNTSAATNVALLGAIALIAVGSGVLVRRSGRLRPRG
jgi:hypothetical protein